MSDTVRDAAGGNVDTNIENLTGGGNWSSNAVLACDVFFPASPSDGTLFEKGNADRGIWVGLRDGGTWFRVRAGDGAASVVATSGAAPTGTGVAVIDTQDFPTDGLVHTVVWDIRVNPGRVRLWIDGAFKGEGHTTDGLSLENNRASTGDPGSYLTSNNTDVGGEPTGPWPALGASGLRVYANQLVIVQ